MLRKVNPDGTITSKPSVEVPREPRKIAGTLQDDTPFPFGKYRGKPMIDVPVDYLHYICHNFKGAHMEPVIIYCKESIVALKEENDDLIWKL